MNIFRKQYKFKEGDIVKQKITGWKVILLNKNWIIDQGNVGEWNGKMWINKTENEGHWEEGNFFEVELE